MDANLRARFGALLCAAALWLVRGAAAAPSAEGVTAVRFPDADCVTLDEREDVAYRPDGTYVSRSESWTKVLTERGRRDAGVVTLDYSARYGRVRIVHVGLVGPDGAERTVDVADTTREATDNGGMAANIVDPLDRRLVCTVPGVKVGDTVHVKIERSTFKSRVENQWSDCSIMEWTRPILKSVYAVTAPAALPVRARAVLHPLGNVAERVATNADGSVTYVYAATNSPRMFPEPDMPPVWTQVQNVRLSTASDWRELSRWYWNLCRPHLDAGSPAMSNRVAELVGPSFGRAAPDRAALRRLFKFVSQEVRYMGLTLEDTSPGYAPHDVGITFDNRYGVCRDKAGLLVAMLRLAGFKAFPVLINVGAKMERAVPQPYFNHAIVAVCDPEGAYQEIEKSKNRKIEKYLLMDPTNENTKDLLPSYLCDKSYLVARPEGEDLRTTPVPPPADNAVTVASKGRLTRDGAAVVESDVRFTGIGDTAYRGALARRTREERRQFFEQRVRAIAAGAELVACEVVPDDLRDTETPLAVRLVAKYPETVLRGATEDLLDPPLVSKPLGIVAWLFRGNTSLEDRRYPLVLDTTAQVTETLALDLGDAVGAVRALPPETRFADGYGYVRRFAVSNDTLTVTRTLTADRVEFAPAEYRDLRARIESVEALERRRATFAARHAKGADVRWRLEETEADVASDTRWTVTNRFVKEVLTYAGKKASSEVKLPFNPAWKNVRVLSATVSNRSGRVQSVQPREINAMDCGWAADAPRYPAGRTLVVNLPSVEIGSVVSLVTETTVTNAPLPLRVTRGFDSFMPFDRRLLRVNGWRREADALPRLPDEPSQPDAAAWRDVETLTRQDFAKAAAALDSVVDVAPLDPTTLDPRLSTPRAIRDWMAKHVRVVGPGLWDVPLAAQATEPAVVVKERYASRLDYVRTLCALLRGADCEADVVVAADDAGVTEEARRRMTVEKPDVGAFCRPLCRVRLREGGFLGLFAETREIFLGTENEYAEPGATAYAGCDYLDPATGAFGVVAAPDAALEDFTDEEDVFEVRENGAVDLVVTTRWYGAKVAGIRRKYAEILPEDRHRHHQELLGEIAQAATATGELETDVKGYPATLKLPCHVPDYATREGDTLTLRLPPFRRALPALSGDVRRTPVEVGATDRTRETVVVRFPEGFGAAERIPQPFAVTNPKNPKEVWATCAVTAAVRDGRLEVRLVREIFKRRATVLEPAFAVQIREWNRLWTSASGRTISCTRPLR